MAAAYGSDIVRDTSTSGTARTISAVSAAAGSNRVLVICVALDAYVYPTAIEWGGSTLANGKIETAIYETTAADYGALGVYFVKEANLASGSDLTVTLDVASNAHVAAFTLTGVNQTDPVGNTATDYGYGTGGCDTSLTATSGSLTVSVVRQTAGSITDTTNSVGWTEIHDYVRGATMASVAYSTSSGSLSNVPTWNAAAEYGRIVLAEFRGPGTSLRVTAHASAAGVTDVKGVVFAAPTSGLTGARLGEFTGATFEATLEGGLAVLKVPLADFGGETLTVSDTPVAALQHPVLGTGLVSCTVIEE